MSGKLVLKKDAYADEADVGALDLRNSNILNVNSIYTADPSGAASEGINFKRENGNFDTLWMNDGRLLFTPNRAYGSTASVAESRRVGCFKTAPVSGRVVVSDGTGGGMISSDYTIATSVPANAVFTDHYAWNDITGKPTTFAPVIGSASTQAAAGNHTHSQYSTTAHNHDSIYVRKDGSSMSGSLYSSSDINGKRLEIKGTDIINNAIEHWDGTSESSLVKILSTNLFHRELLTKYGTIAANSLGEIVFTASSTSHKVRGIISYNLAGGGCYVVNIAPGVPTQNQVTMVLKNTNTSAYSTTFSATVIWTYS